MAASGPAYEAIQSVGEEAFELYAVDVAREQVRDGLPLRAEFKVAGYLARKPATRAVSQGANFLPDPEPSPAVEEFYAEDLEELGYVMNGSRLWGRHPESWEALFGLIGTATEVGGLSFRQRAVMVTATAATIRDSHSRRGRGGLPATRTQRRPMTSKSCVTQASPTADLRDHRLRCGSARVLNRERRARVHSGCRARRITPASGPRHSRFRAATAGLRLPWSLRTRRGASHPGLSQRGPLTLRSSASSR